VGNVCKAGLCTVVEETAGGATGCCLDCVVVEFSRDLFRPGGVREGVVLTGTGAGGVLSDGFVFTGAGEAKGLRLLFVLGFKFFFWNSACIFHKPFSPLLSSEALLGTPVCLAELPCLL